MKTFFFLEHIQIGTSSPDHINVFQWKRECFFFRHIELNSKFLVLTKDEVTLKRPKNFPGFSVTFLFCRFRLFRFALKLSTEIFAPYKLFPLLSGFSEFVVSSSQVCCTIFCWEFQVFSPLWRQYTSFALFSSMINFRCVRVFLFLNICDQNISFPSSPAINAYPRNIAGKTFLPN